MKLFTFSRLLFTFVAQAVVLDKAYLSADRPAAGGAAIFECEVPVSSLRTFVVAGLVRIVQSCQCLNTIGCNRAMFTFASDPISKVTHTPKERTRQPCN